MAVRTAKTEVQRKQCVRPPRRPSRLQRIAFAWLALAPFAAQAMGFGASAPTVTALSVSPAPTPANAQSTITCSATDSSGVVQMTFGVSGGSLAGAASQTIALASPQTATTQSVTWTTPDPGTYSVTCAATNGGGVWSGPATTSSTISVDVVTVEDPPSVAGVTPSASTVFPGAAVQLAASVSGTGLTYAWSATAGALSSDGPSATWTAPPATGPATVTLVVTDSLGRMASGAVTLDVVWANAGSPWSPAPGPAGFRPTRIALDAAGFAWVSDTRAGEVTYMSPRGDVLRRLELGGAPAGVAVTPGGQLLVADPQAGRVDRYEVDGRLLGSLGRGAGEFVSPRALAVDPSSGRIYVADPGAGAVKFYEPNGVAVAGTIALAGGNPAGLAFDPARRRLYLSDSARGQVLVFDSDGAPLGVIGSFGAPLVRPGGLAVAADGNIYVADAFQSQVAVFSPAGALLATVGAWGSDPGQLEIPLDVALDTRGRLLVTNTQLARVETFQLQSFAGVTCPGDSDCDGMPDSWEIAHHLNPFDPTDARLDPDHDGLTNLDECLHGTDPWNRDTDGDGVSDGDEVAMGSNPLDPSDHRPVLVASGPGTTPPGLVRLSASLRSSVPCAVSWTQLAGPAVTLRDVQSMAPSFVARSAARYRLQGIASCGAIRSAPAVVEVLVENVAPRPDPGRIVVLHAGTTLALHGAFSSDANGDAFSLMWDQTAGTPLTETVTGTDLVTGTSEPSLLGFALTATDAAGASATAEVPVLVVDDASRPPTAVAGSPVVGRVGESVGLAAGVLGGGPDTRLVWSEVQAPEVRDLGLAGTSPSFVPLRAGRYVFDVTAVQGRFRSPPARVDVFVSDGAPPPVAVANAPLTASVGATVTLDGAGSSAGAGGALGFEWSIVSGPPAGLTDASTSMATLVPFGPGSLVVELRVNEGDALGIPVRVRVDVHESGRALPVAVAAGPGAATPGQRVTLSGAGSQSPTGAPLAFRWTQTGGPWVPLDGPGARDASFHAVEPGTYTFELEVFDGHARSAPAGVAVVVTPPASGQERTSR